MSVSQVKKRFGEFESYLRGDKEGLRRLKLLKDDVNVLRTSLAAAEEKAEQCEVVKDAARDRADIAESELKDARIEIHRLNQHVASLMTDLATVTKPDKKAVDMEDTFIKDGNPSEFKSMLKRLCRAMPSCPRLIQQSKIPSSVFLRQDFAGDLSYQSMWALGASVAILAAHEGSVTIVDPVGVVFDTLDTNRREDGFAFTFIRWFQKNIDMESVGRGIAGDGRRTVPTLGVGSTADTDVAGSLFK